MADHKLEKLLVRPVEAAFMLSVSRSKIYEMLATGELPPSRKFLKADTVSTNN